MKLKKRILTYLLALGITLFQCVIVFAEYDHQHHEHDNSCVICLVASHLSHALPHSGITPNLDHCAPFQAQASLVSLDIPFGIRYFIRGPPLA